MISLDNEPDLWQCTHARLRGDANPAHAGRTNASYAEMVQRTVDYAECRQGRESRRADLRAGELRLAGLHPAPGRARCRQSRLPRFLSGADGGGREPRTGHRLVDVLDVHWYPEAQGARARGRCRITEENTDAGVVAARKQAPRSLWDPTYSETSWITHCARAGPSACCRASRTRSRLTIRARGWPSPNTTTAAGNHISGAIAQADVLGIFGREGLFAATLWRLTANNSFIYGGFEMFRNYDGANGSFGDTSIRATNSDSSMPRCTPA